MLKERVSEERYPDLNEEDITMGDSRDDHLRDVYENVLKS